MEGALGSQRLMAERVLLALEIASEGLQFPPAAQGRLSAGCRWADQTLSAWPASQGCGEDREGSGQLHLSLGL